MATRMGLWDGRLLSLFPRKLTNTARSATLLQGMDYATRIENIVPNNAKSGSGAKRYGMGKKGSAITGENILETIEYRKSTGAIHVLTYTDAGKIYTLNEGTGAYTAVKTGLSANGTLFWQAFNGKLVFCNGVDANFSWDGTTCTNLGEYVTDYDANNDVFLGSTPVQIDNNTFTIARAGGDDKYPNGRSIRVTFATAGTVTATISSTAFATPTLTVNVTGTPFPGVVETITKVEYWDEPIPFSYLFAEHNILFALSGGILHPTEYRGVDGMKVYYTDSPNNENAWFNMSGEEPTQEEPFFNIENRARIFDELLAIRSINGSMAFMGRNQIYLYVGEDPSGITNWSWSKTIPVGLVHPKLVQDFPSDVLICTSYGLRSLSRAYATEALEISADLGTDIEGDIAEEIRSLLSSSTAYRKARSFYYAMSGYFGFKLDDNRTHIYVLNNDAKGWVEFTGYFADARCFLGTSDGRLLIGRGEQLYAYANGTDNDAGSTYSDDGDAYNMLWESPWLSLPNQRWSNRGWEIIIEEAQSGTINLTRYINTNMINSVSTELNVIVVGSDWDIDEWDTSDWEGEAGNPISSDRFICDDFRYKINLNSASGPYSLLAVKPIGR